MKTHIPEDSSLDETIRLAQCGIASAFEQIYRLHCRHVYALCLRMTKDPSEAEDLTQEVFLQLFRKLHTFRGEAAFSSWLYRLTTNLVLMSFRKKKFKATSLDQFCSSGKEDEGAHKDIGGPDPQLAGLFDRINLEAAIDELPDGSKTMFLLHDVHGYHHSEIAEILGCSAGNSKSQLHRARKRMRHFLRRGQRRGRQQRVREIGDSRELAVSYSCPVG